MSSAARLPDPRMDVPAFLDWKRGVEGRWELDRGLPVEMQSERVGHNRAKRRCAAAMERAIGEARLPCEVFADGMDVVVTGDTLYIPDALVRCGDPLDDDTTRITDPMIVIEVLSPSNSLVEMTTKIDGYFSLPSVAWVLLVNTVTRIVHSYARGDGALLMRRHAEGESLRLDPPGIALAVADLLPVREDAPTGT